VACRICFYEAGYDDDPGRDFFSDARFEVPRLGDARWKADQVGFESCLLPL